MDTVYSRDEFKKRIENKLLRNFGRDPDTASEEQLYIAACIVIRDIMSERWLQYHDEDSETSEKQVYYLSMEFLPGTSLKNNVFNLGVEKELAEALADFGRDLEEIYRMDPDAGLGNGGLGRLASCYLDAAATQGYLVHGMSICYEYGIFKQKIVDGEQTETPDHWLDRGESWLITKREETQEIHFGGKLEEVWDENGRMRLRHKDYTTVLAVPRDMLISGYGGNVVNTLRLWQSKSPISIDMELFAQGKYLQAMEEKHRAEIISKILYPEDAHREGKELRIKQQYFFISATIQYLVKKHLKKYGSLDNFAEKNAIHINDTHPAMAIPELMRVLMDCHGYSWERAWKITVDTVSYTNHTVMPEALEKWPTDLFQEILPRLYSIIGEIGRRFNMDLFKQHPDNEALRESMSIVAGGTIRMANMCVVAANTVNGVSALHSNIIRDDLFGGFSAMTPGKFTNVTNGIAYRRWLCQANPLLTDFITELIGDRFKQDASELEKLTAFKEESAVGERLSEIKRKNKERLADYIYRHNGIVTDPASIFDVQVKRLHEYKRQLLNLFHIMYLYNEIKKNPGIEMQPRTFIFGAKAAAGYRMAKRIISLACNLSEMLERDDDVRGRIKVVFLENYSVSLSEIIMPAAEISEQISLAGKEASGTGNMKLMLNGAVTLGTEDGANVEIHRAVGDDNIFIFGMNVDEAEALRNSGHYNPWSYFSDPDIAAIMMLLNSGINGVKFGDIANSITNNTFADRYFVLADFESYRCAQEKAASVYQDKVRWNRMSLMNIAKAGVFSADRAVSEYAKQIWHINSVSKEK